MASRVQTEGAFLPGNPAIATSTVGRFTADTMLVTIGSDATHSVSGEAPESTAALASSPPSAIERLLLIKRDMSTCET